MIYCLRFEWLSKVNNLVKNDLMNFSPPFSWDTFSVSNTSIWGGHIDGLCLIGSEIILFPCLLLPIAVGLAATAPCSTSPVQLAACWDQLMKQALGENHQWEEKTISGSSTSFVPQVVSGSKLISCMTPTLQCRSCLTLVYAKRPSLLGFYITVSWLVPPAFPLDCFMSPACVSAPPSTVQMHYVSTDWSGFCFHDSNMTDISTLESST